MEPITIFLEKDGARGRVHELSAEDLKLHPSQSMWYTESYFFIAYLESGEIAYIQLIISNLGLKKNQPGLTLTVITPDRRRLTTEKDFPPEALTFLPGGFGLGIGDNRLSGTDRELKLSVRQDQLALELQYVDTDEFLAAL